MSKDILGSLPRALATVPESRLGLIQDITLKLADKDDGDEWEQKLKAFLRKEPCWTGEKADKPAKQKSVLLEFLGTAKVSATTEPFVAKDRFVENTSDDAPVKIWNIWDGFKTRFLQGDGKVEQLIGDIELRYHRLKKCSVDTPILEELGGGKKPMTTLTEIWTLLTKQPKGEKGTLLVNGYANIFYVETEVILPEEERLAYTNDEGKKVVLCAVGVRWGAGDGWRVNAYSVLDDGQWSDGFQVFSRNSVLESSDTPASEQS